ncbi:neuropeptide SIFamide receptor-like [Galendromus occidentalis]|uniref:Neuropeptide SIFamide receptor-like n=1 Tax=Galendromus occidentalis TaxID=34638 RepID=A0AAJ7SE87_9ACAR|nr:neuropeptide SIFamide receptor-like [Galendromus occidentalis]
MRTVTNHLIVNLACVDIIVLLVCVPSNLLANLLYPWKLGLWACKVTSYLQAVTVSASIQTLVAISVDRCVAICSGSLRRQMPQYGVWKVVALIWTVSLAIMSPILIYQGLERYGNSELTSCVDNFPSEEFRIIFSSVVLFAGCYFLPLFVITASYLLIYLTVWRRAIPGETLTKTSFDHNKQLMQRSKLKVVRMMLGVVSTFFVSWGPLYAIHAYFLFCGSPSNQKVAAMLQIAFSFSQWLGMTNSCINPILYGLFNKRYRRGFRALFSGRQNAFESSQASVRLRTQFNRGHHKKMCPTAETEVCCPSHKGDHDPKKI